MSEESKIQEGEPFADEAKFFTESRLLQRDVEIVLESVTNQNFLGSVLHPVCEFVYTGKFRIFEEKVDFFSQKGNIAEFLLSEGFAKCIDWSIAVVTGGPEKLRAAEK